MLGMLKNLFRKKQPSGTEEIALPNGIKEKTAPRRETIWSLSEELIVFIVWELSKSQALLWLFS